jgi:hypothetical protein
MSQSAFLAPPAKIRISLTLVSMPILLSASKKPFSSSLGADNVRDARMSTRPASASLTTLPKVYLCFIKIFCAVIQVLRVYKNADALAFMLDDCHKK